MFNNLEAEQARKGLTNQDIANYLEISRQSYEIKKKNGNFKYSEITKLLDLFTVSFEYLFAKDEIAQEVENKKRDDTEIPSLLQN